MDEIFLSLDKQDINNWLISRNIVWPGCPRKFWLLVHFVILNLPTASPAEILGARRYIYSQGGQIVDDKLYHEELFNPPHELDAGLNLGR